MKNKSVILVVVLVSFFSCTDSSSHVEDEKKVLKMFVKNKVDNKNEKIIKYAGSFDYSYLKPFIEPENASYYESLLEDFKGKSVSELNYSYDLTTLYSSDIFIDTNITRLASSGNSPEEVSSNFKKYIGEKLIIISKPFIGNDGMAYIIEETSEGIDGESYIYLLIFKNEGGSWSHVDTKPI